MTEGYRAACPPDPSNPPFQGPRHSICEVPRATKQLASGAAPRPRTCCALSLCRELGLTTAHVCYPTVPEAEVRGRPRGAESEAPAGPRPPGGPGGETPFPGPASCWRRPLFWARGHTAWSGSRFPLCDSGGPAPLVKEPCDHTGPTRAARADLPVATPSTQSHLQSSCCPARSRFQGSRHWDGCFLRGRRSVPVGTVS